MKVFPLLKSCGDKSGGEELKRGDKTSLRQQKEKKLGITKDAAKLVDYLLFLYA